MSEDKNVFCGILAGEVSAEQDTDRKNVVYLSFQEGIRGKVTFLEEAIFRYDVSDNGMFPEYAKPRDEAHTAKIQQRPDESDAYAKPEVKLEDTGEIITLHCGRTRVLFDKKTAQMSVYAGEKKVMEEARPLEFTEEETAQTVVCQEGEQFYGGGTQNGRFVHTGKKIQIVNESAWMDGGVASPNPFYYTTGGYGVLRNTFSDGVYDFGESDPSFACAAHKEHGFSAYYFVTERNGGRQIVMDLLRAYYHVTGNPLLLPEYGFYEGHLNCYNRDAWSDEAGDKAWNVKGTAAYTSDGTTHYESGMAAGYRFTKGQHSESLNGETPSVAVENYPEGVDAPYEYSARAVMDQYIQNDMPLGYFLPNDGYGSGYGKNGYYMQGGVLEDGSSSEERLAAVDANVENLARFTEYANGKGVASGLWTESNLSPDSEEKTYWHLLRDFRKEVARGGVTTLKTDVAWVGPGYSFQLNGVKTAYDIVTTVRQFRPNIISLDGWAGSQRFNSVWSGDQTGGNWEYIRFHIPTYIGSSLSGNPNIGSDMDGIFGGKALIAARDYQWKSFTPQMLNMDGWGSYMKAPFTFGDPYTGINRMYMKMKSRLMPYIYTCAAAASNLDTGNHDTGLPMVRAMFLEYPEDAYAYSRAMQYQFMLGPSILVAPVYQNVAGDEMGNDVRNHIYLPDPDQIWVDYLTGEQYQGGQVLNNFDAPLWKLPVFVKKGAILPMYEANNTPDAIRRNHRIIEVWPAEETSFTVYEDDGKYLSNAVEEEESYGIIDHISYGDHVAVRYTAKAEGTTAVLTAEMAEGSYDGYLSERTTTWIVNLSAKPEDIHAEINGEVLQSREAEDKERFESQSPNPGEVLYFYEESPALCTYASAEETEIAQMTAEVRTAPKLYIKLPAADTAKTRQSVEIRGFAYEAEMMAERKNEALPVPELVIPEEEKTSTSVWIHWNKVEGAAAYEMLVDGQLYAMGDADSYLHDDLEYHSEHCYQIRSRNKEGYSEWSSEIRTMTLADPWRNEIGAAGKVTFAGSDEAGPIKYATDHSFRGLFFSAEDVAGQKIPFIYDFGAAYELDKFEYYPRDSYGSGTVQRMNVYSSMDGRHWKLEWDGTQHDAWTYNTELDVEENVQTIPLAGVLARFVKLEVVESTKNYFAAHELPIYKKDGSRPVAVGSTNKNEEVAEGDYTNMKNYLGTSIKDGSNFVDQIQKRGGDINQNGVYDVYDYAFTMFKLDGGTKQTGTASGTMLLVPEKTDVKAGETFTVAVMAEDVENVNAFGKVIDYDPARLEFVSEGKEEAVASMEDLTVNKVYGDGTAYVNLAFANRGDKPLYSGSGKLAVITMKALTDLQPEKELNLEDVLVIGPDVIQ